MKHWMQNKCMTAPIGLKAIVKTVTETGRRLEVHWYGFKSCQTYANSVSRLKYNMATVNSQIVAWALFASVAIL